MSENRTLRINRAAELLTRARATCQPITALPDLVKPTSAADSYAIQARVTHSLGRVGGWKVVKLKSEPHIAAAPLHSQLIEQSGAHFRAQELHSPLVEVEIAFAAKQPIPAEQICTAVQDPLGFFEPLVLLEILSSRFQDAFSTPVLDLLADNFACGAIVLGTDAELWDGATEDHELRVWNSGEEFHQTVHIGSMAAALETLASFAELTAVTGGLEAGQVITTGSLIPPFIPDGAVVAMLGPLGQVRARFRS